MPDDRPWSRIIAFQTLFFVPPTRPTKLHSFDQALRVGPLSSPSPVNLLSHITHPSTKTMDVIVNTIILSDPLYITVSTTTKIRGTIAGVTMKTRTRLLYGMEAKNIFSLIDDYVR